MCREVCRKCVGSDQPLEFVEEEHFLRRMPLRRRGPQQRERREGRWQQRRLRREQPNERVHERLVVEGGEVRR